MEPLNFNVTVSKDDLLQWRRERHRNVRAWIFYIVCFGLISLISGDFKFILMGLAAFVFISIEIDRHRLPNREMKVWTDVGDQSYRFDDSGVLLTHSKGQRKYEWGTITGFRESASAFQLFYLEMQNLFIPKRCLSEDQIVSLRKFLSRTKDITGDEARKRQRSDRILFALLALAVITLVCIIVFNDQIGMLMFKWRQK